MSEKVILITGASSGIGKICAEYLTTKEHIVYGTSRHSPSPPTNPEGNSLYMIRMDIQDGVSVQQAIEHIIKKQGRIDVVINNAGYGIAGPVEETSMQRAHEQLETNLFGAVRVCISVLPHMRMQKKGLIINISSLGGLMGLPFQGFYSASKYALEGFTEALRLEVKAFGINVTLLEPGDIQTSFTERREKSNIPKDSVYHTSFQRVMNIVEEEELSGVPPIIVARRLEKIINIAKPRQRYRVGSLSQRFVASMKGTVPDSFIEYILRKFYHV